MSIYFFSETDIQKLAFPAVIQAGRVLFEEKKSLRSLQIVNADIIATFKGEPACTAVISQKPSAPVQSVCTCGFGYGSACEHVIAAMFAVNAQQSIQTGLDLTVADPAEPPAPVDDSDADDIQNPPVPARPDIPTVTGAPAGRLYLKEREGLLLAELRFAYLDGAAEFFSRDRSRERLVSDADGRIVRLQRSLARETMLAARLQDVNLSLYSAGQYTPNADPVEWVRTDLLQLAAEGFEVYGRESLSATRTTEAKPSITLAVSGGSGGFTDCTVNAELEGVALPFSHLYDAVITGNRYVKLSDGSTGVIPEEWIQKLAVVFAVTEKGKEEGVVRVNRANLAALDLLESMAGSVQWDEACARGRLRLRHFESSGTRDVPETFKGTLRHYQQAGYEWFHFLQEFGLGGCLADDMGLGKTIQTLVLLLSEKARKPSPSTSLLVVPTSLLFNWSREARTFGPALLIMTFHGPDRRRYDASDMAMADVVLTTYGTLQRDIDTFKAFPFNYVILDEAQAIKNPLSETGKVVRQLRSAHRLALSGTPVENNLSELWSLFTFLNPGMLGPYSRFAAAFVRPVEKERNELRARLLRQLIAPCILRRTKQQVAKELPPKTETIVQAAMTPRQKTLYDITRDACRAGILRTIDDEGMDRARMQILQALTRLRQICCHPRLVDPGYKGDSGKFEALEGLLENIVSEGHKALIFSQFVSALELVRERLDEHSIRYEILTGQTANRQRPVDSFQNDAGIPVMLISLKAGGVGLNLTAADYVIMLDPWWNPAAENQAADRAYRIGQTRPVFVYKLIMEDSVEERVIELQRNKKALFDSIISEDAAVFKNLGREEIARLFDK